MKNNPIRDLENQIASLKAAAFKLRAEAKEKDIRAEAIVDVQWELERLVDVWKSQLEPGKVPFTSHEPPICTCSTAKAGYSNGCLVHGNHSNRIE